MSARLPLTMSIGEVLWDMIPGGKALGGAPTNVAWHAAQLGARAHVASAVGRDALGGEILDSLKSMSLDVSAVSVIPDKPTSTVDALIGPEGNATYVIHDDVAWDAMPISPEAKALAARAEGVNYGSLAQRSANGRKTNLALVEATPPGCLRIFDVNLRPPFIYEKVIADGLAKATVVKMNEDELPVLGKMFSWPRESEAAIAAMMSGYPNLRHAVITRGAEGVWWHDRKRLFGKKPAAAVKVVDSIGAGDSFTAAVMMGLLKGWAVEAISEAALAIASFVCASRGGTPELPESLKAPFLT